MSALLWIPYLASFAAVAASALAALFARGERIERMGFAVSAIAAVALTAFLALRWPQAGHPPIFGTFENTAAAAWSLLAFAVAARRLRGLRFAWRFATPWALALMLWGARFPKQPVPLTISEQSLWVDVHVAFAWAGFVPLLVAGTMALAAAIRPPAEDEAAAEERRRVLQTLIVWGFFGLTGMLVTGSWYLNVLFGAFWQWGVVETVSLLAWVLYGLVLHGVLWRRWRGRFLFWAIALTVPILLLAYLIWSVFPGTFHFFDIPLVRPY